MSVEAGDSTPSGFPRIVRMLPSRFSRDPKATRTTENTAAGLLLLATVAAILWANSPWADSYWTLLDTHVGFSFGDMRFELTVKHLINDGLMTFFFFIVGLEVKAEFTIGELTDRARAAVPVFAAIAGLAVPALIFLSGQLDGGERLRVGRGDLHRHRLSDRCTRDHQAEIPCPASAFPAHPGGRRRHRRPDRDRAVLLPQHQDRAVADCGGVDRRDRARFATCLWPAAPAYAVVGFALWVALYVGGVHPTLAGVAIALLIPVFTPKRRQVEDTVELIRAFRQSPNSEYARAASRGLRESISINERLQTEFGPYVSFLVLPLFALVNAGVRLTADTMSSAMRSPLTWGIVGGLVLGKFIGITGATWLVQRFGWGELAPGLTLRRIAGGAALSGIGFTISLFIIDIAIGDPLRQDEARVGVLLASVLAFLLGWAIFRVTDWVSPPEPVGLKLVRPVDPARDHVRGNPDAPLTLVEYGDFECPFCSRATGSIDQVRAHFGDEELRYVWRHLPLERVHPRAFDAARASEAAALQGKFWEMARQLFSHQDDLEWSDIYRYAVAAGCDIDRFDADVRVHASKVLHRVQDDAQDAEVMDLNSTPTFFVNGKRHKGPWDAASLIRALEAGRQS